MSAPNVIDPESLDDDRDVRYPCYRDPLDEDDWDDYLYDDWDDPCEEFRKRFFQRAEKQPSSDSSGAVFTVAGAVFMVAGALLVFALLALIAFVAQFIFTVSVILCPLLGLLLALPTLGVYAVLRLATSFRLPERPLDDFDKLQKIWTIICFVAYYAALLVLLCYGIWLCREGGPYPTATVIANRILFGLVATPFIAMLLMVFGGICSDPGETLYAYPEEQKLLTYGEKPEQKLLPQEKKPKQKFLSRTNVIIF
jgi:hypothetical protein